MSKGKPPGVRLEKHGAWTARLSVNDEVLGLGYYETEAEARAAHIGANLVRDADYALIGGLRAEVEWLNKDKCLPCDQSAEIAALKAELSAAKTFYEHEREVFQREAAVTERLRAEKVGHIQLIGGQEAEIIKLRAELAEFKTARVMSGPEDAREYVHNHEVAHAKLRGNK